MATVDFTIEELVGELLPAAAEQTRQIVKEELTAFEPRVRKIVRLENIESEARIKQEVAHFVSVDQMEMKKRLKSAALVLGGDE